MYSKKGVVHKLHAVWFINRTPGELKKRLSFLFNFEVFSVEIPYRKRGKHLDCWPQVKGFRTRKMQHIKHLHCR